MVLLRGRVLGRGGMTVGALWFRTASAYRSDQSEVGVQELWEVTQKSGNNPIQKPARSPINRSALAPVGRTRGSTGASAPSVSPTPPNTPTWLGTALPATVDNHESVSLRPLSGDRTPRPRDFPPNALQVRSFADCVCARIGGDNFAHSQGISVVPHTHWVEPA